MLIASCGGGGGGGGGVVSFAPAEESSTNMHNGGGNGGWGAGTQVGDGFDGGSDIQSNNLLISQMAALSNVTNIRIDLVINGKAYPSIVADSTTTMDVLPKISVGDTVSGAAYIYVAGEPEPRVAQLDSTNIALSNTLTFKVPYKYSCLDFSGAQIASGTYFSRDGINLQAYTTAGIAGWQCVQTGLIYNGSLVSGIRGDITLIPVAASGSDNGDSGDTNGADGSAGEASDSGDDDLSVQAGIIKTDIDNGAYCEIDNTRTIDYAAMTGLTVNSSDAGYITVRPLQSVLYTETQSGTTISLASYDVTVVVGGTAIPLSFSPSDTKAVKIAKIPFGTSVSASAVITVAGTSAYTTLNTETAYMTVQANSGTATMYVKYPIEFNKSSAYMGSTSLTGTMPEYYTSNSPLTLPVATNDTSVTPRVTSSYRNLSTSKDMRFIGWAFENNGTPVITDNIIPAGAYKGKLTLYSSYEEVSVSISGAGSTTPYLFEGNTIVFTAEPSGFPAGATITYSWRVIPPTYPLVSPATITSDTDNNTVTISPVTDEIGNCQIEVTVTCGSGVNQIKASKTQNIIVGVIGVEGLQAYLDTLTSNGSSIEPNVLPRIHDLTTSSWKDIRDLLRSDEYKNIYIDMSATILPAGITDMEYGFATCWYLTKPPQLPATMNGSMKYCFERCYLTEAPVLPTGVTNLYATFYCAKFTTAPVVPDTVTDMQNCFDGCDQLTGNVIIKANITDPNKWSCAFGTSLHPGSSSITIYVCSPDAKQAILDSVSDYSNPQIVANMIKVLGVDFTSWPTQ